MITNLDDYKAHVLEVAKRVKDEEGWCDEGFREVMKELEIELPPRYFEMVLTVEVVVRAECTDRDEPSEEFIASSVNAVEVALDSDWDNEYVSSYNVTAVEVDRISEL